MDGIFFDEAPNKTTALTLSYMQSAATAVQLAFPPSHSIVMTNPGVQVDARFYASADYINVFENTYAAYTPAAMAGTPAGLENKATFMVHSFTGDAAAQQQIVERAGRGGYAGWLVTTENDYDAFSELWDELCAGVVGQTKMQ
ncbi:MAG: hypothetical protein FRX48_09728 [Lasallia pustulata]|nr:MAG: hypothetical protein FRX48_09728 [Lasallia pustulata]